MKPIHFFFFCICFQAYSQTPVSKFYVPNGAHLYDSVFIDSTEIANIHWREYISFLSVDSATENYNRAIPDSTVWNSYPLPENFHNIYFTSWAFRFHPVVGITFEQAVNYCRWRSAVVNSNFVKKNPKIEYRLNFRLPTEKEWEYGAAAGLLVEEYPYGFKDSMFSKPSLINDPMYYYKNAPDKPDLSYHDFKKAFNNFRRQGEEIIFNVLKESPLNFSYGARQPLSIFAKPNKFGLSNSIGNVAEMTNQRGIAKGGSWAHDLESSQIQKRQFYKKPEAWLGFRCVCEVKKR